MAAVDASQNLVQAVLANGPIPDPFPTLEEARSDAGPPQEDRRDPQADQRAGDQVHLLPADLRLRPRERQGRLGHDVGEGGRGRLPARLRRHRRPVRRPLRPLHRLRPRGVRARGDRRPRHVRAAALGLARRPRVLRLLRHGDRRAARGRPAPEPEADRERGRAGARLHVPVRDRARDDVDEEDGRPERRRGHHEALVLPHQPVRGAAADHPRRDRLRRAARDQSELRRPRGLARPARAELPLRPRAPHRRQPLHLPPDLRRGRAQRTTCSRCFMPKPFTGVSANGAHHHFTLVDEKGNNVFYDPDGPAKLSEIGLQFMGGILDHYRGLCAIGASTVNSYKRFWDFGFWAPIYKDYGWQNRTCARPRGERRPLRVPRRRLGLQPVPDAGGAAPARASTASSASSTPARRSSATSTTCSPRAARSHACPATSARRSRRSRRTRSSGARCRAVSTMCSCTTSATSGSASWRPSPTGSASATWTCCP